MFRARFAHGFRCLAPLGAALFLFGIAALVGCSSSDKKNPVNTGGGGGGGSTSFTGLFTGQKSSGQLTVTINASAGNLAPQNGALGAPKTTYTATGTASTRGTNVSLSGNYDPDADGLGLMGSGYSFNLAYDNAGSEPLLTGFWSSPYDTGEVHCIPGATDSNKVMCGIYHSTTSPPDSGQFTFDIKGTKVTGFVHDASAGFAGGIYFEGSVTYNSGTMGTISINFDAGAYTLVASGSFNLGTMPATMSGTYTYTDVLGGGAQDMGNWSGGRCTEMGGSMPAPHPTTRMVAAKFRP